MTRCCFSILLIFLSTLLLNQPTDAVRGRTIPIRFPKNNLPYKANTGRRWKIDTDYGDCLLFRLKGLSMESSYRCSADYLNVFDGNSMAGKRLLHTCGFPSQMPPPIRSTSNHLYIAFHSNDNSHTGRGFDAAVTAVQCSDGNCGRQFFAPKESGFHALTKRSAGFPPITFGDGELTWDRNNEESSARIVGGEVANPHSWPWQIAIRFRGVHICGATLVSNRFIVSAAHCFKKVSTNPQDFEFWAGKHRKNANEVGFEQLLVGEQIILHPEYGVANKHDSDLAIIRLRSPGAVYTKFVSPICLPSDDSVHPADGARCYVSGWGSTKGTGNEEVLKQATVPIISNQECVAMETRLQKYLNRNMLCAGYEAGGHDSCQGDSGGPLQCKIGRDNRWVLSGVVSFGYGCAGKKSPGVYVRTAQFLEWFHSHINDLP